MEFLLVAVVCTAGLVIPVVLGLLPSQRRRMRGRG